MNINYNKWWSQQKNSHSYHPSVRLRNRFILQQLKKISFTTLIDVWCWDWYLLSLIKNKFSNKKYTGIDISDDIIFQNKKNYPWIDFFQWDLWQGNIHIDYLYDVVVCSEVIEHIYDWKQVVKNLSQLVDKKWYLILTTQSWKRYKSDINIWHLKHFTLSELEKECSLYGLKVIQSYKKGYPFYNLQKRLYEKIEQKAKNIQQSKLNFFGKILFNITYFSFLLSIRSKTLWPQIFMLLQKK
jgi:hypothetical protein